MQAPSRQVTGPALRALLEDGTLAGEWVPLRSAEIFDSGNYPHITFTADGIRLTGQDLAVAGALTVRDRTRALSFDAAASVPATGKSGSTPPPASAGPTSASAGALMAWPR